MMSRLVIAAFLTLALCALVRSQYSAGSGGEITVNGVKGKMVTVAGKSVFMPNTVHYSHNTLGSMDCVFAPGKGVGKKSVRVRRKVSGQKCLQVCANMKKGARGKDIDAVTMYKDETKKGCWCISLVHDVSDDSPELKEFKTCYLDPKKAAEAQAAANLLNGGGGGVASNACPGTGLIPMLKGCYVGNNNNRYFYNERLTIDWSKDGFPKYGKDFVCACADAAMKAGIHMFGTHFWGECWELKEEDLAGESADGCMLADGLFQTTTCNDDSKACIGMHGYGVHEVAIQ